MTMAPVTNSFKMTPREAIYRDIEQQKRVWARNLKIAGELLREGLVEEDAFCNHKVGRILAKITEEANITSCQSVYEDFWSENTNLLLGLNAEYRRQTINRMNGIIRGQL